MNIHIDEIALQKELTELYLDSERASEFIGRLINISNFVSQATPTNSNIAIAKSMIDDMNIDLGGEVIRYEGGIYGESVANLDAESIRFSGSRIWRAIVDMVRRVINALRSLWNRFFGNDEEKSRKMKTAMEFIEEQFARAEATHRELNLGRRETLGKEMQAMLRDTGGLVFVDGGKRTIIQHPDEVRANILLTINLAQMTKEVSILGLLGKEPISSISAKIRGFIENANEIKSLGSNTDLFNFCRKVTAISTERDFLETLTHLDQVGKVYQENAKRVYENVKRKTGVKNGIPIGGKVITMSFTKASVGKQGQIPYTTATTGISLSANKASRINGSFSFQDMYDLMEVRAELSDARKALETIAEEYNGELEYFTGDGQGEILKDATVSIGQLEVSPAIADKIPGIQQLPKDIHNILMREQKVFDQSVQAIAFLSNQIDQMLDYIMKNSVMFDGAIKSKEELAGRYNDVE